MRKERQKKHGGHREEDEVQRPKKRAARKFDIKQQDLDPEKFINKMLNNNDKLKVARFIIKQQKTSEGF